MGQRRAYDPKFWVFGNVLPENMALMKELGFDGVGFWAADRREDRMRYYFGSPTLRQFPWAERARDRYGCDLSSYSARAHAVGLKVMANMEGVNPYHWPAGRTNWTPEIIAGTAHDMHRCGADRWFTECVAGWPPLFRALGERCREIGMEYQEGSDPSYLHHSDASTGQTYPAVYRQAGLVSMYHYFYRREEFGKLASLAQEGTLAYGFARGWGHSSAVVYTVGHDWGELPEHWEGILKPTILIRALQFRVNDIMVIGPNEEKARQLDIPGLKEWVSRLVERNAEESRPVLNVVVHLRVGEDAHWRDFATSGDAITCGAFHAGYDVVTSMEPLADAAAYYVYTTGSDSDGTLDLTPELAALFRGHKPVFLQVGYALPSGKAVTPAWREALSACGVNADADLADGDLPPECSYRGAPVKLTGVFTAYTLTERPHGALIPLSAVTGEVIADGGGLPVIVGNGTKRLIAVNCLRWQMMGPISDLLAGCGVSGASDVWGIAGGKVTALLAIHDTELDIRIPRLAQGAKLRVTQWDKRYRQTFEETVEYHGAYRRPMKQFDSVVIEAV